MTDEQLIGIPRTFRESLRMLTSASACTWHATPATSRHVEAEVGDDEALVVPRAVAVMLAQVLGMLADGQGVQILPNRAMLTTQQAADMLNVSRPYLIGLLESGQIPYTMVGTHRRVEFESLLEYQRGDYQRRRAAAEELTRLGEELGGD